MSELTDLYQEIILDHNKRPRNFREMPACTHHAEGNNPLCGDEVTVYARVGDDTLDDVSFTGHGCAISRASASLMTGKVKGRTLEQVRELSAEVRAMLLSGMDAPEPPAGLGDLVALSGVRQFPARIKCAMLPWHTLDAALRGDERATTE